ncbi:VRR-NUC domain-containing protein [Paraburkholderia bryophila]|uniref:VRR-NUC domain-containing protein n=1 Tax=Paraburkholderia bryophila TaxID=420952 RepID=A0A329B6T3_9BURK|nr:VRR-NUC domain-containing protein [Paraburkholderia bryophila]RAS17394.1 VRR-NUC domain-containing protein [Paraburkholderia bryophila]
MSDYGGGSASGGMSPGEGQTTQVGVNGRLSKKDRVVLCSVLCKCKVIGVATRNGRIQRQRCVQQRLDAANEVSRIATGTPTEYRPEQTYNMQANPPEPVTDPDDPLQPHSDLRKWIEDFWPGGRTQYKAGQGNLRRPDVVVVNDPTQPPVQSNISQVVEFKFPPDAFGRNQERDYIRIAGARSKFVTLGPAECGCGDDDSDSKTSTQKQSQTSTDMDDVLGGSSGSSMSNGGGLPPALPPPPVPPVFP